MLAISALVGDHPTKLFVRDGDKLLIILLTHGCVLLPQAIGSNNKNTDSMSNTVPDNGCTEFVHLIFEKTIML